MPDQFTSTRTGDAGSRAAVDASMVPNMGAAAPQDPRSTAGAAGTRAAADSTWTPQTAPMTPVATVPRQGVVPTPVATTPSTPGPTQLDWSQPWAASQPQINQLQSYLGTTFNQGQWQNGPYKANPLSNNLWSNAQGQSAAELWRLAGQGGADAMKQTYDATQARSLAGKPVQTWQAPLPWQSQPQTKPPNPSVPVYTPNGTGGWNGTTPPAAIPLTPNNPAAQGSPQSQQSQPYDYTPLLLAMLMGGGGNPYNNPYGNPYGSQSQSNGGSFNLMDALGQLLGLTGSGSSNNGLYNHSSPSYFNNLP